MADIKDRNSPPRWQKFFRISMLKSSSDPTPQSVSRSYPNDGSSNAPSRGSIAAAGSPRIGRTSNARRSHSCASLQSASCSENYAIQPKLSGQTLRGYWHVPFRRSAVDVEPIWRGDIGLGATPAVDIVDKDDAYKLTAELPGVDERQVEIRFARGTLTVKGKKDEELDDADQDHFVSERRYGDFHRSFRVPDGVDPDKIEASFKNGVLSVTLPKTAESRRKQKKVEIKR